MASNRRVFDMAGSGEMSLAIEHDLLLEGGSLRISARQPSLSGFGRLADTP